MATTQRKLRATWDKSNHWWVKVYKGHRLFLARGTRKNDMTSYQLALDEFDRRKAEIDQRAEAAKPHYADYKTAIGMRREMLAWLTEEHTRWPAHDARAAAAEDEFTQRRGAFEMRVELPDGKVAGCILKPTEVVGYDGAPVHIPSCEEEFNRLTREVKRLDMDAARAKPPALDAPGAIPVDPLRGSTIWERNEWETRCEALRTFQRWTGAASHAETIGANIDAYIERKRADALAGNGITPAWVSVLKPRLGHLHQFCGQLAVSQLNGKTLEGFHTYLVEQITTGKLKPDTAKGILTVVKSFVTWLWESEITETLPRNLRKINISVAPTAVRTVPLGEIKALLDGAHGRTRLFLLLMLNCGMTQQDISELRQTQVDWVQGVVTRKRSKTHNVANVPTVAYKLWPETFTLLKQFRSDDPDRVLTNGNGLPLRQREFKEDGRARNIDNIRSSYFRLCERLKPHGAEKTVIRPLKLLRKTAASMLENHPTFGRDAQYFLGHAATSVAERHYIRPSQEQFDAAVAWLGEQFGLGGGNTPSADNTPQNAS